MLSTPQRIALFVFAAALFTASTAGLKWVYGWVNGYEKMMDEAHQPLKRAQ